MASSPQPSLKIPLILVVLGLIGYIGTNYYTQQQEFTSVRTDLENARKSLSENLIVLQQQSEQRAAAIQKLSQDNEAFQKKLSELEASSQTEKSEKAQLIFSQQEAINFLKEQHSTLTQKLNQNETEITQNETEIRETKAVQAQMIPIALETRKLQQQIDGIKPLIESMSARLSNLQEQISIRNSMQTQTESTKNPNPLRSGFP